MPRFGTSQFGLFIPFPGNTVTKYVDVINGDDTNNGDTAGTAYQTLQKAIDEVCKYIGNLQIIMADGTYTETVIVPVYGTGQLDIIGDVVDPSNVVLDFGANFTGFGHGGSLDFGGNLSIIKNNLSITFDGVTFSGGVIGVFVDNSKVSYKHVDFVDNVIPVVGADTPQILFAQNSNGSATITHSTGGLTGIQAGNQGSLTIQQDLTITNFTTSISTDSSKVEFTTGFTLTCNLLDTANAVGLDMDFGTDIAINGTLSVIGNAGRSDDIGVFMRNGSSGVVGVAVNADIEFEDLAYGIKEEGSGHLELRNATETYTSVTTNVYYPPESIYRRNKRITSADSPYTPLTTEKMIFVDTDGGATTVNLPVGEDTRDYVIVNTGSSANNVTVTPNGAELLEGVNASVTLTDTQKKHYNYQTTEGWW